VAHLLWQHELDGSVVLHGHVQLTGTETRPFSESLRAYLLAIAKSTYYCIGYGGCWLLVGGRQLLLVVKVAGLGEVPAVGYGGCWSG